MKVLADRQATHGDFARRARIVQQIKITMHQTDGWARLEADQRQALDMIADKVSRILAGDPNHSDHWHDIAGYATLVDNRLCAPRVPTNEPDERYNRLLAQLDKIPIGR
ncbi:MAG: hypothetical protein KGL39_09700 [Patescibacteria group bacterium]|nr:hypothetical protein [Patescibacteria group bacterium]